MYQIIIRVIVGGPVMGVRGRGKGHAGDGGEGGRDLEEALQAVHLLRFQLSIFGLQLLVLLLREKQPKHMSVLLTDSEQRRSMHRLWSILTANVFLVSLPFFSTLAPLHRAEFCNCSSKERQPVYPIHQSLSE